MLTTTQLRAYRDDGFVVVPDVLTGTDLDRVRDEAALLYGRGLPGTVYEKDGRTVRGVHGIDRNSALMARLVRLPTLLGLAEQVLGESVYVYQSKINAKRARRGEQWPWHQDFTFWWHEDGMRAPLATNVAVFLDDAVEQNGPLLLVPTSHRLGTVPTERRDHGVGGGWASNLAADLDYTLSADQLEPLVARHGVHAAIGAAGSVLVFDPRVVHSSGANTSSRDRQLLMITYNSVRNRLAAVGRPRPDFLAATDTTPLTALAGAL